MKDLTGESEESGGKALFPQTLWTVVLRAKDKSATAMNSLLTAYRPALIAHLRATGHSPQDAEDLTQAFIAQLLARDFLANVGREKGRFRTFLLHSLNHFLCDWRDKQMAQKRGGGRPLESLDATDPEGCMVHNPADSWPTADIAYDKAWARAVLANALRRLEEECALTRHTALARAIEPVLYGEDGANSYREIGDRFGMSEGAVKMAALRLRNRLRSLIREEISQTVGDASELEGELQYLVSLFGKEA